MNESMYETLMELPVFAGVSHNKISEMIGKYRFHFLKYHDGEVIVKAGEPCTHLKTLVTGTMRLTISNPAKEFSVSQKIEAPAVIYPDFFFGKTTNYPSTAIAIGQAGLMQIDKNDYLNIISSDHIALLNFLNILSMNSQLSTEGLISLASGSLGKRISYWIATLTQNNAKEITLEYNGKDLHSIFGVSRQALNTTLNDMKEHNLIDFTRNHIYIPDRRRLLDML